MYAWQEADKGLSEMHATQRTGRGIKKSVNICVENWMQYLRETTKNLVSASTFKGNYQNIKYMGMGRRRSCMPGNTNFIDDRHSVARDNTQVYALYTPSNDQQQTRMSDKRRRGVSLDGYHSDSSSLC